MIPYVARSDVLLCVVSEASENFERHLAGVAPPDTTFSFHAAAPVATKVDLTVKPLAIGLEAFGAIAAPAKLLISLQLISRQLIRAEDDLVIL